MIAVTASATGTPAPPAATVPDLRPPTDRQQLLVIGAPATAHRPAARVGGAPHDGPVAAPGRLTVVVDGVPHTTTVHPGDTLSGLAAAWLGDPDRWREIYRLNQGRQFPTVGGTLRDPDLIYPGWVLTMPADATPPPGAAPAKRPDAPPTATPTQPATTPPSAAPSRPTGDDGLINPSPTAVPSPGNTSRTVASSRPGRRRHGGRHRQQGVELASGSWVDLGLAAAVAAAASLVWVHRRRRYVPRPP